LPNRKYNSFEQGGAYYLEGKTTTTGIKKLVQKRGVRLALTSPATPREWDKKKSRLGHIGSIKNSFYVNLDVHSSG